MLASLHAQVREIGQVGSPASFGPLEAWGLLAELNSAHKAFSACYQCYGVVDAARSAEQSAG
jgi:hypothetical protein